MSAKLPPGVAYRGDDNEWSYSGEDTLDALHESFVSRFGPRWSGLWLETQRALPTIGIAVVKPAPDEVE